MDQAPTILRVQVEPWVATRIARLHHHTYNNSVYGIRLNSERGGQTIQETANSNASTKTEGKWGYHHIDPSAGQLVFLSLAITPNLPIRDVAQILVTYMQKPPGQNACASAAPSAANQRDPGRAHQVDQRYKSALMTSLYHDTRRPGVQ